MQSSKLFPSTGSGNTFNNLCKPAGRVGLTRVWAYGIIFRQGAYILQIRYIPLLFIILLGVCASTKIKTSIPVLENIGSSVITSTTDTGLRYKITDGRSITITKIYKQGYIFDYS